MAHDIDARGLGDVAARAAPAILARDVDLALLGSGDPALTHELEELASRSRGRVGLKVGFDAAGIEIPFPQRVVWTKEA